MLRCVVAAVVAYSSSSSLVVGLVMTPTSNDLLNNYRLVELPAARHCESKTFLVVWSLTKLDRLEAELLSHTQSSQYVLRKSEDEISKIYFTFAVSPISVLQEN